MLMMIKRDFQVTVACSGTHQLTQPLRKWSKTFVAKKKQFMCTSCCHYKTFRF